MGKSNQRVEEEEAISPSPLPPKFPRLVSVLMFSPKKGSRYCFVLRRFCLLLSSFVGRNRDQYSHDVIPNVIHPHPKVLAPVPVAGPVRVKHAKVVAETYNVCSQWVDGKRRGGDQEQNGFSNITHDSCHLLLLGGGGDKRKEGVGGEGPSTYSTSPAKGTPRANAPPRAPSTPRPRAPSQRPGHTPQTRTAARTASCMGPGAGWCR